MVSWPAGREGDQYPEKFVGLVLFVICKKIQITMSKNWTINQQNKTSLYETLQIPSAVS